MTTVAILGGGVAGLSAAHELVERGFKVKVYEMRPCFGGKARSMPVPPGDPELEGLPAEHGFRFFPGFYRHIIDTMKRINPPATRHLTPTSEACFARKGGKPLVVPLEFKPREILTKFRRFVEAWPLSPSDALFFLDRVLVLLTSCNERRLGKYENIDWWEFSDAAHRSREYQRYCAEGLTRTLVAAQAREMSARTAGYVILQLMFDILRPGRQVDRVLDGPTSDVWINPWVDDLRQRGVDLFPNMAVQRLECAPDPKRITRVIVQPVTNQSEGPEEEITADLYVCAVPCEIMKYVLLSDDLCRLDSTLCGIKKLKLNWMNGVQIYLNKPFGGVRGHVSYTESEWALTSIAQRQFWNVDLSQYGGRRRNTVDILSVDISDWSAASSSGKTARDCGTAREIHEEVVTQIEQHLNRLGETVFDHTTVVGSHVDEDISDVPGFPPFWPPIRFNLEPLLINTRGSWRNRPQAQTKIENLFLASDYVQTHTDLATMEGANEAARRAVNAILLKTGCSKKPCELWQFEEPAIFAPLRWLDRQRYRRGLPHDGKVTTWARRLLFGSQVANL